MKAYKPIEQRHPLKIVLSLLLACTIVASTVSVGLLSPTAVAADMTIEMGTDNGLATYTQLRAAAHTGPYVIEDQYDVIWGTETEVDIFKSTYVNGQQEITVAGSDGEAVIAPGTENTYTFALKNKSSGYLDYKVIVEAFFTGLEGTDKVIPVHARLQGYEDWLLGSDTEYKPVLELDQVEESAVLSGGKEAVYTLQWQWPFEQDLDGDGNVDDGDALDTWLATQTQDISLTIRITTLSSYHYPSRPPQLAPIPKMLDGDNHYAYLYGFSDGTIRPEADITRAQVAAIFYRLLKEEIREEYLTDECAYPDVAEDAWYRTEVATLTNVGLIEGYTDGTFCGEQPVTRAELASILARLSGKEISAKGKTAFNDIKDHWAEAEIKTIEDFHWIEGYGDGTFRPDDSCSRAETATMINRMLHRSPEKLTDLLKGMKTWPDNANVEAWYYLTMQEASNSHSYVRLLGTREKWKAIIENPWENEYQVEKQ